MSAHLIAQRVLAADPANTTFAPEFLRRHEAYGHCGALVRVRNGVEDVDQWDLCPQEAIDHVRSCEKAALKDKGMDPATAATLAWTGMDEEGGAVLISPSDPALTWKHC
jgi:hypothetical protein